MSDQPTTAQVMANAVALAGVTHVFAYPGDPIVDLMEALRARRVDVVLGRREGTAAFMAEGQAMSTGSLGACLSTLGPGSTAMVNGVAAAHADRVPMLALSGQIETSREQFFTHQVVDHKMLFSPVTKWAGRVEAPAAATTMRKAISLATAERPGAVHLTIAGDTSGVPSSDAGFRPPPRRPAVTTVDVLAHEGSDPVRLLLHARRPVLLAGLGAVRADARDALVEFAERLSLPVVVAPMAKGVFPEDHPLFAGVLDMACNQVIWELVRSADLVVAAGFDAVELIKPWSISAPVLHVDALQNTDQIYESPVECVGDVAAILRWLAEEWKGEERWTATDVAAHRGALREAYYAGRVTGRLNPTDVVDVAGQAMSPRAIATCDVGSHKLLIGQGWHVRRTRQLLMSNGLSSMGFGVPAAIGAKLAHPDRPVIAMVGDGGFAMAATELRLASALGLGIAVVVFVDGSLNRIELKQAAKGFLSTATPIEDMDLVRLAEAMACDGVRAHSAAELETALSGANRLTRPLIVEAHVDPSQYASQF